MQDCTVLLYYIMQDFHVFGRHKYIFWYKKQVDLMHCVLLQNVYDISFFTIVLVKITSIKVKTYPKKSSSRLSTYKIEDK